MSSFFINFKADPSDEEPEYMKLLAQAPPCNPKLVNPCIFPKYEEENPRDEEGNLIVNGVPLKKIDVEPLVVDDFIKEEWPRLELKVHDIVYKLHLCTNVHRCIQNSIHINYTMYRIAGNFRQLYVLNVHKYVCNVHCTHVMHVPRVPIWIRFSRCLTYMYMYMSFFT